jgi:hypothetical protein
MSTEKPADPAGTTGEAPNLTPDQREIVRRGHAFLKSLEGRPQGSEHLRKKMQSGVGPVPEDGEDPPAGGGRS